MTSNSRPSDRRGRPTRWGAKIVVALAVALVAGWFMFATWNILFPALGDVQDRSNAIVSLAPQYHRLATTEELIKTDHAGTLVTSRTHAFRAGFIFEHYLGPEIDVDLVYADPDLNAAQWAWHIACENAALVKALWQTGTRC